MADDDQEDQEDDDPHQVEQPDEATESRTAVLIALAANLLIAALKGIAFFVTGSASLLAEALHSFSDSGNSLLLLVGLRSAQKPPDDEHPYGYGKDAYFWSLLAALFMVGVISTQSINAGFARFEHPRPLRNASTGLLILGISALVETAAVVVALRAFRSKASARAGHRLGLVESLAHFRATDAPAVKLVLIEDLLALAGVLVAMAAVAITERTGIHQVDGIGAMVIGVMIAVLAVVLAREYRTKLIGTAADLEIEDRIQRVSMTYPPVRDVREVTTMVVGPNRVIAHLTIELDPHTRIEEMDDITAELERRLMRAIPQISDAYIEVIADEDPDYSGAPIGLR